ncbi:rp1-4 protein [Carex littledalei]|uniref:Rp1-4 protein n=1 Tax=Carex littledalei TaxID=544730 RepID=A0A833RSM7_9POAL|nr:rp1-4 protein [Carex littledalei]
MAEALALAGASWGMSIAGWVASPIISKLLNQGFSYLEMDVAARIETLEVTILPQFQEVIDVAEKHGYKSNMEKWLRRLKDAMYEAEDAIDFYKSRLLQQKWLRLFFGLPSDPWFDSRWSVGFLLNLLVNAQSTRGS